MGETDGPKQLRETVVLSDAVLTGKTVKSLQTLATLTEADFVRLQGRGRRSDSFTLLVLGAALGQIITLGPKISSGLARGQWDISVHEVAPIVVALAIAALIYVIGRCCTPDDRKAVMEKLSRQFDPTENSPNGGDQ